MKIHLEKGRTSIEITIPDEQVSAVLTGKDVPAIRHDTIRQIISEGIKTHSPGDIIDQKIAIIIPDDTRLWARGDLCVPLIVKALLELGVSEDRIKIIIALGTHEDMDKEKYPQLAGTFGSHRIDILNSACNDQHRLVPLGETSRKTRVLITREAVDADHIIIFGGLLHHQIAGFGGGRKYIVPGIAGYDTIQQNHALAIRLDGTPHPNVLPAKLAGNPINEDLTEAADIFLKDKTCTYVAVAANGSGEIFHCDVGPLHATFLEGCQKVDHACSVRVPRKADFVLFSAGGHRTDGQLYQATKALFNAVNVVKEGGELLFVAGCEQGVGNETYADALRTFREDPQKLGYRLTQKFNMPAYVALRCMDVLQRFRVSLVSDFSPSQTQSLGFNHVDDMDQYIRQLKGRGYIIPFAENILPIADIQ